MTDVHVTATTRLRSAGQRYTGHRRRLVDVPPDVERTLDRALDRIAKRAGFARVSHRLDLVGLCADCARSVR